MEVKTLKEGDCVVLVGPKDTMTLHVEDGKIKYNIEVKKGSE